MERFQIDKDRKRGNKLFSKRDHRTYLAPTLNLDVFRDETKPNLSCDELANTFIFNFWHLSIFINLPFCLLQLNTYLRMLQPSLRILLELSASLSLLLISRSCIQELLLEEEQSILPSN